MSLVPAYYLNQDDSLPASIAYERDVCHELKAQGVGQFFDHGKKFRLFSSAPAFTPTLYIPAQPDPKDQGHDGFGRESCRPEEPVPFHGIGVMSRAVDYGLRPDGKRYKGDPKAKAIIRAWKFHYPITRQAVTA